MHIPELALEVFCPRWLEAASLCVVLQHERVLCMSQAAQEAGVQVGMRASSVRMLAPQAQVEVRDGAREQAALQACALALLQYTPQVACVGAAGLVLDVGASLRLFGGIRALCRRVRASMHCLGFTVRLACAPYAAAAQMLALLSPISIPPQSSVTQRRVMREVRVLRLARVAFYLDRLPCAMLPEAQEFLPWLDGLACYQLGQLRALPRAGLQRRCGTALILALDQVYGQQQMRLTWVQAAPSFSARLELFARIEHSEALQHAAQALVQQLMGWLQVQHLALLGIALIFEHERGRAALAPTRLEIVLASPCSHEQHLLRLIAERLAKLPLPAAVMAVGLQALQLQARQLHSESLFPDAGQHSVADFQRLVELLVARLGKENVLQAQYVADHRPEVANCWGELPQGQKGRSAAQLDANKTNDAARLALPRPLWLLPSPVALAVQRGRPVYAGEALHLLSSAERIEAGWFSGEFASRDYFIAQNQHGVHYWLYRQRISSEDLQAGWFLQGLFA